MLCAACCAPEQSYLAIGLRHLNRGRAATIVVGFVQTASAGADVQARGLKPVRELCVCSSVWPHPERRAAAGAQGDATVVRRER